MSSCINELHTSAADKPTGGGGVNAVFLNLLSCRTRYVADRVQVASSAVDDASDAESAEHDTSDPGVPTASVSAGVPTFSPCPSDEQRVPRPDPCAQRVSYVSCSRTTTSGTAAGTCACDAMAAAATAETVAGDGAPTAAALHVENTSR